MSKKSPAEPSAESPSFEAALANLEQIVSDLEDGGFGLEESMQRFEQGVKLLRVCYATLERAEQRIELLVGFDKDGRPRLEPFEAPATFDRSSGGDS